MKDDFRLDLGNYKNYTSDELNILLLEYMAKEHDNDIENKLLMELITKYADISKKLEEKVKEIELISVTDPLTKIYNRLKFNKEFIRELERFKRYEEGFSVIMLDIDHFKRVNDTYGHDIGDKTLIRVTQVVKEIVREGDIFARWGGEEFIILVLNSNLDKAVCLAERIRQGIEETHFEEVRTITCSFGVTAVRRNDTIISASKRADEALYKAKETGRNKVESQ